MQTKKDLSKSSNNDDHSYLAAFNNLEHKIENMFKGLWHNPFHHEESHPLSFPATFNGIPKIDVIERDKEIFVKAELPGIDKKDIDISISNNRLVIKACSHHEHKEEKGDYLRQEIRSSEIFRSIQLPGEVDDSKIKTTYKNGLLELTIPKHESSHRRRIEIE
ncbi:MAG: Hsp20/alpha crystallin family protein [Gammaproteobacteria bacterium]|nr:Hsp20/alpha crystallin family protein [Gammaproteobacteria bacterium]